MTATPYANERHFTQPPDEPDGEMCPFCDGYGVVSTMDHIGRETEYRCDHCDGTGTVDPQRAAEDRWDAACDDAYERAGDR